MRAENLRGLCEGFAVRQTSQCFKYRWFNLKRYEVGWLTWPFTNLIGF